MIYGRNPVAEFLSENNGRCFKVLISSALKGPFKQEIRELCRTCGVVLQETDARALDKLLEGVNHQGIAAKIAEMDLLDADDVISKLPPAPQRALVVILDHLEDPHNAGAIARTAFAAGASCVMLPVRRGALPTGIFVKSSAGAALRIPIALIGNVANAIKKLQNEAGFWAIGLEACGKGCLLGSAMPPRLALVIGSEDKGLGRTTQQACDEIYHIPMKQNASSLNASAAAALGIYEWFRCAAT